MKNLLHELELPALRTGEYSRFTLGTDEMTILTLKYRRLPTRNTELHIMHDETSERTVRSNTLTFLHL